MSLVVQMVTALEQVLVKTIELQQHTQRFERKEIARAQFVAGVEEISAKIVTKIQSALCVEQKRTERCQVCDRTYPASEIVRRGNGEQLCFPCYLDKYPIQPEDIPF